MTETLNNIISIVGVLILFLGMNKKNLFLQGIGLGIGLCIILQFLITIFT